MKPCRVVLLLVLGSVTLLAAAAIADELPKWRWKKLVLLNKGVDYEVELIAADPEKGEYLTTPWPDYPTCGGKCLTVISPTGEIVKVIRKEDAANWKEAPLWRDYERASGRALLRFPVKKGNSHTVEWTWPRADGTIDKLRSKVRVLGEKVITIAAGTFTAWEMEEVLWPDDRKWESVRHFLYEPNLGFVIAWRGREQWELKSVTLQEGN